MDNSIAIRCRSLVKDYGAVRAVNGLDLEVRAGECFSLPCVEHVDDLYENIQALRQNLDA